MVRRILAIAAVALCLPAASQASMIYLDPEYSYNYNPLVGDFYTPTRTVLNAGIGPWKGHDLGGTYWADFYCLDITTGMYGHGHYWDVFPTNAVPANVLAYNIDTDGLSWAAYLYNKYGMPLYNQNATLNDKLSRAGLQIAVWEAIYDNNSDSGWDLDAGDFRVLSLDNISYFGYTKQGFVDDFVQPYLDDDGRSVATYWNDGQDLLGPPAVPEPTTLALLGLGLAGSGLALRKRRRG